MRAIDYFLDRITMYRLVLYLLIILVGIASILGFFQIVPFSPVSIISSALLLTGVSLLTNKLLSWAFDAPTNVESAYITALILTLIVSPVESFVGVPKLAWVAVIAMLSKYVFAIDKKHIFNPSAIAVVITAFAINEAASWWVGTAWMAPFVAICGLLIFRKLRFGNLAWSFFTTSILLSLVFGYVRGNDPLITLNQIVLQSSLLFLGSIMLTEPITMPPTKKMQLVYGGLVGFLSVPQLHLASFSLSPEHALCLGNIFAYLVSPKARLVLPIVERVQVAKDTFDIIFKPHKKFSYQPGQYMEWTVTHAHTDSRGNRRYFTIASSPTEDTLRLGIKYYSHGSSFKKALVASDQQEPVVGAQLAGEFTLPKDPQQKLAFLAGGIGITPFRSMIKYLLDTHQQRDIVLCYSNKVVEEVAYQEIFAAAKKELGINVIYTLTNRQAIPADWQGERGRIDAAMIKEKIPDFAERLFYLSGPQTMVNAYEETLKKIGVKHIKKDYFPGLV